MVIAYVGSGGKTTLLKQRACAARKAGLKVFVTTSTHMYIEKDTLLTDDAQVILHRLRETGYAMAGIPCGAKIGPLSEQTYQKVCACVDLVLVEADGSRHMPIKFPAEGEPVIYENVDEIIVVCGMHAVGHAARDVCHRLELVKKCLGIDDETIITAAHIRRLVEEGYLKPLHEKFPEKRILVQPNEGGFIAADWD